MSNQKTIILSAGGTGGHMFPALALADHLMAEGYQVILATDHRGVRFVPQPHSYSVKVLRADTLRSGLIGKCMGILRLMFGVLQGMALVLKTRPACVVGFGGYPSVPAVLAAQILRVPTVLHQSDAVLGAANRWLANGARAVALSHTPAQWPHKTPYVVTGNPIRKAFAEIAASSYPLMTGDIKVLVVGGSLGAAVFADVIPAAILQLPHMLQQRIQLVQQVREDRVAEVQDRYDQAGIRAETAPFFTDMPAQIAACHLFVGRSGASTVSELTAAGRPAIFIPYPHHADRQQYKNAEAVVAAGGAWIFDEVTMQPDVLAAQLQDLLAAPEKLLRAADAAKRCGYPYATQALTALVLQVAHA